MRILILQLAQFNTLNSLTIFMREFYNLSDISDFVGCTLGLLLAILIPYELVLRSLAPSSCRWCAFWCDLGMQSAGKGGQLRETIIHGSH